MLTFFDLLLLRPDSFQGAVYRSAANSALQSETQNPKQLFSGKRFVHKVLYVIATFFHKSNDLQD